MFSGFSRRQLLKLISGLVAGAAAVGSLPFIGKLFISNARAQERGKPNQEVKQSYKGRTYRIKKKEVDDTPQTIQNGSQMIQTPYDAPVELYVDDKKVDIIRNKKSGKYQTVLLPFTEYDSPVALARAMIDLKVVVPTGQLDLGND